jgi:hypothetical protein
LNGIYKTLPVLLGLTLSVWFADCRGMKVAECARNIGFPLKKFDFYRL